jgi:predicted transcriptional regulator
MRTTQIATYDTEKTSRRGKALIVLDIIAVLNEKERKFTHLLYKSNLSCDRLKHYLGELIEKGIVIENHTSSGTTYQLSDEGVRTHVQFSPFAEFIRELEA